jgi:hypothetical protein
MLYIDDTSENIFTFYIKPYVSVISDTIRPLELALRTDGNFAGVSAIISGWGLTTQRKCIAISICRAK